MTEPNGNQYVVGVSQNVRHAVPRDQPYTRHRVIPESGRTWWEEIGRALCGADATRSLVPWGVRDFCETFRDHEDCPVCVVETRRTSGGIVITDDLVIQLAEEAERGYDISRLNRRPQ